MSRKSLNASTSSTETIYVSDARIKRFKVVHVDQFRTLATMHLSFLMDLNDTGLEEIIGESEMIETGRTEKTRTIFSSIRKKKPKENISTTKLFGARLTPEIIDRVFPIMVLLSQTENLQREGVFRVSGNSERQKELRERLDNGDKLDDFESKYTVNDYATVFKSFLAELPEPLLTEKNFNTYVQIAGMTDQNKQIQCLQLIIQLLPAENFHLLQRLLGLLSKVAHESQTKMNAENLAILFTPHLIVPRKTTPSQLQQVTELLQVIVVVMISRSDVIFCFPLPFAHDVLRYCKETTEPAISGSASTQQQTPIVASTRDADDNDVVISTMYTFTDRQASWEAARKSSTESALSDLYSQVCQMPESLRKRKLVKEFSKVHGTPTSTCGSEKIKITNSITASIRRFMSKRRRLITSSHFIKEGVQMEELESPRGPSLMQRRSEVSCLPFDAPVISTPVIHLFKSTQSEETMFENSFTVFGFQEGVRSIDLSPGFADVYRKAVENETDTCNNDNKEDDNEAALRIICSCAEDISEKITDKCCGTSVGEDMMRLDSSDSCNSEENKENNFVSEHIRRLITQQNSPSIIPPKGYISPLACVSVTPKKNTQMNALSSSFSNRIEVITDTH